MDFKGRYLKPILLVSLIVFLLIGLFEWVSSLKANPSADQGAETISPIRGESALETRSPDIQGPLPGPVMVKGVLDNSKEDDAAIQQQLDRDREEQKQTKYLKNKLEQTNLELDQEKALAEINRLKMENGGAFKEPLDGNQKDLPVVKVQYIGGDNVKKEAILFIAGASYQVKERSRPIDNIQVVSISDSSVTLHFSAPQELTKTIDYKPE